MNNIEVDQQTNRKITELQVRNQLSFMHFKYLLNRFQFDDDYAFDKQVDPIADINLFAVVDNR